MDTDEKICVKKLRKFREINKLELGRNIHV